MRGGNFPGLKGAGSGYRNVATTPGAMENKVLRVVSLQHEAHCLDKNIFMKKKSNKFPYCLA